jgi:hypothetical protein
MYVHSCREKKLHVLPAPTLASRVQYALERVYLFPFSLFTSVICLLDIYVYTYLLPYQQYSLARVDSTVHSPVICHPSQLTRSKCCMVAFCVALQSSAVQYANVAPSRGYVRCYSLIKEILSVHDLFYSCEP